MPETRKPLGLQTFEKLAQRRVEAHTGIPYSVTQQDMDAYASFAPILGFRSSSRRLLHGLYPNEVESTRKLTKFLDPHITPTDRVVAALTRCEKAASSTKWGPENIIKALSDLDTGLFNGQFKGLLTVYWVTSQAQCGSNGRTLGRCIPQGKRRSTIYLYTVAIFKSKNPELEVWPTMIHELLRAYINATSGCRDPDAWDTANGFKGGHGWQFRWLINLINQRVREYMGFNTIRSHSPLPRGYLLRAARTDLVTDEVADEYLARRRTHDKFWKRFVEPGGRRRRRRS